MLVRPHQIPGWGLPCERSLTATRNRYELGFGSNLIAWNDVLDSFNISRSQNTPNTPQITSSQAKPIQSQVNRHHPTQVCRRMNGLRDDVARTLWGNSYNDETVWVQMLASTASHSRDATVAALFDIHTLQWDQPSNAVGMSCVEYFISRHPERGGVEEEFNCPAGKALNNFVVPTNAVNASAIMRCCGPDNYEVSTESARACEQGVLLHLVVAEPRATTWP